MDLNNENIHPTSLDVSVNPSAYWTKTRREICSWLNENSSSLANLYEGAVHLVFEKNIPGRLRFISHAVREIRNRLPDSVPSISQRLNYKDELDQLIDNCEKRGFSLDEMPLEIENINNYQEFFEDIRELIIKHKAVELNNKEKSLIFFESSLSGHKLDRSQLIPVVNDYWKITEWFMKKTHDSGKPELEPDDNKICQQFELFESFLTPLAQKFFTIADKLDEIIKEDNPQQIDKVIGLLIHPQHFHYFFSRLQNPAWIEPLKNKGFFQKPPSIIEDRTQGTIIFPIWAESRYLAQMAKYKPKEVLKIALQIETDNPRVHEDFVDAVLQMPSQEAVHLVNKVKIWIESQHSSFILPEKLAALIVHLAKGGNFQKALDLARILLTVMPDSDVNNGQKTNNKVYIRLSKPQIRFENWDYQEIIRNSIPELVTFAGKDKLNVLKMLNFLLFDAIQFSHDEEIKLLHKDSVWEDSSHYWQYAIEEHPRNYPNDEVKKILVTAIKNVAEQILNDDKTKIRDVISLLEKQNWRIFYRIALYLIRKYQDVDYNLLIEKLLDRKRFANISHYEDYEYAYLLKDNFCQLPVDKQKQILDWIENPELDYSYSENQQQKAKRVRYWQLHKLVIIKDSLSIHWQKRYEQLVNEFGAIEILDIFPGGFSDFSPVGVVSPKTDLELESLSIRELVDFLKTWQPNSTNYWEFEEPSRSGLGDALARIAEKNPQFYAQGASQFQCLDPTYLSHLLRGLRQALNNHSQQGQIEEFDWTSILSLCNWIAEKSEELNEDQAIYDDPNNNWLELCRTVGDIIGVGLSVNTIAIPFNFRNQVWDILRLLTQHPDPTPEREIGYYSSNHSYSNLAINTVRGEAMHTVVRYALWVRRHFEQLPESAEQLQRGFDEMPEVRQVLDEHLNLEQEPSLAIRSVYGQWFPWLVLLDPLWTNKSVEKIFTQDEISSNLRLVAWESYITYCHTYDNVFDLLYEEYSYRVEQLKPVKIEEQKLTITNEKLIQHLMTFYWRGKLNLDDSGGLLTRFFELASDQLRGYAIKFVGRSLKNTQNEVNPQILNTLQLLWEKRLEIVRSYTEISSYTTELAAFGWWFGSGKLDDFWSLTQIKQVLELVAKLEPDFLILKRLALLVDIMPELTVECLELMIKKDKPGWSKYGWQDETKTILSKSMRSNNIKAMKTAENIIHELGRRGCWEYRNLLPSSN